MANRIALVSIKGIVRETTQQISGVMSISLEGAIQNGLLSLTAYGGTEQRNLPSGYTEVEYTANTAATMINTGLQFDFSKNYEIELRVIGMNTSWYILQARETPTGPISGITGSATGNTINFSFNGVSATASNISRVVGHIYYVKATVNSGTLTLYVKDETDGTEETVSNTDGYTASGISADIGLFGNTVGNYVANNSNVYYVRIKENGDTIMEYVPCKEGTTVGFYDKASGTFKTTTNLSAGADVVPTPDNPMDIVSNNGALKARHQSGLPTGYTQLEYIESSGTQYIDTGIKINSKKVNVKAKVLFPVLENGKTIFGSQINNSTGFGGLVFYQTTYGGLGGCFGSNYNNETYQSISTNTVYNIEYNANNGNGSLSINGVTSNVTYTGTLISNKNWYIFWSNGGREEYKIQAQMYSVQLYDNDVLVFNGIPAKRNSDNVVGMYDFVSGQFFTNQGTGNFTAGNTVSDPIEIYTDGTVETLSSTLSTATAQMLLKVGDYADEQEILSGNITRKVGIKVFDGTETFINGQYGWITEDVQNQIGENYYPYCTHFVGTNNTPIAGSNTVRVYRTSGEIGRIYFGIDKTIYTSTTVFQQWLADQYNAGTPVIIVYLLATPTTEAVARQTMNIPAGDSTIEITQASIDNLELSATYKALPSN